MRKYIIIAVLFISLLVDFIFFDYDISDIRHKREDTTEMVDKLTNSMTMDFPIYFQKLGFHIKNCKDYYKYKPEAIDAFEKENLRDLEKKCDLIKILLYAKVSKNSFLDTILLTDYKAWSSDIYFNYTCDKIDLEKYKSKIIKKDSLTDSRVAKVKEMDSSEENIKYSEIMLYSEISRYIGDLKCTEIKKILKNDIKDVIEIVSKYNQILYDWIIPKIVDFAYELEKTTKTEDKEVILLKEPEEEYYTFKAKPELVITNKDLQILGVKNKSFHADTYCFDSKPEKELFLQYIKNKKIKEIYFTGMFTNASQTDFYIQYIDPDSNSLRKYYPDFIAKFENDTYEIIEVKGDNKIDDAVVNAKKNAALEIASESKMKYTIYKSSTIMSENVLDNEIK